MVLKGIFSTLNWSLTPFPNLNKFSFKSHSQADPELVVVKFIHFTEVMSMFYLSWAVQPCCVLDKSCLY